jgi:hypothetical protein
MGGPPRLSDVVVRPLNFTVRRRVDMLSRWFRALLKFGVPLVACVLMIASLSDHVDRWPVAATALGKYPDQTPVLIGFSYRFAGSSWRRSASYLLVPSFRGITVSASSSAQPTIETSSVVGSLLWFGACLGASAWLWLRSPAAPPNNRWRGP